VGNYLYSFVYPSQSVGLPRLRQRYAVLRKSSFARSAVPALIPVGPGLPAGKAAPIFGGVLTISITAEALAAIAATLPENREADRRPDGKGAYFVTLPRDVLDKLNYPRGPGESYSDVILRLAREPA
jgi:hypothetical protein